MIDLVLGGQYGSEGKGSVIQWLAKKEGYDLVIRTGGSQAGHTMLFGGVNYKMRMLPCAWHTDSKLALSRQAVVDKDVVMSELKMVAEALGKPITEIPLYISPSATLLEHTDSQEEKEAGLEKRIGSTTKGVGRARSRRIMRTARTVSQATDELFLGWVRDYNEVLYNPESRILIESTQGWGLSLFGAYYPQCTSIDLNPYAILADAGIPWKLHKVRVIGVLRTFPIRVGGNSGELKCEISWGTLRKIYGKHIRTERTTVTNRIRRVGFFEWDNARQFVAECNPDFNVLTFADYIQPGLLSFSEGDCILYSELVDELKQYLALVPKIKCLGVGIGKILLVRNARWSQDTKSED